MYLHMSFFRLILGYVRFYQLALGALCLKEKVGALNSLKPPKTKI